MTSLVRCQLLLNKVNFGTCVITSWDDKFIESKEWTTGKGVDNLDQPFYHILLDDDDPGYFSAYFPGHFNVAEGNYY